MYFEDFIQGLQEDEYEKCKIDQEHFLSFVRNTKGSKKKGEGKYESLPLDVHLVIKHENRGKI